MAFRLHPHNENPHTVLNWKRPKGFHPEMTNDEDTTGISACWEIEDLAKWAIQYSTRIHPQDYIVLLNGETAQGQDIGEVICYPTSYKVIGTGWEFSLALDIANEMIHEYSTEDIAEEMNVPLDKITPFVLWSAYQIGESGRSGGIPRPF